MERLVVEFSQVALAHLLAVASPGPDFAVVLRQSLVRGRGPALRTALGVGTGILLHVAYSLLGLGLVLRSSPLVFSALKIAGAAYLAWLGVQGLRARPREVAPSIPAPDPAGATGRSDFAAGFLTNALNPKATLFFVSLFALGVDPATPKRVQAAYGLWMAVATCAWFSLVAILSTAATVRSRFLRSVHWLDRGLGVVLLALAAAMLVTP
jgi:RhtB (resistance to homoserine/threonine) family protein